MRIVSFNGLEIISHRRDLCPEAGRDYRFVKEERKYPSAKKTLHQEVIIFGFEERTIQREIIRIISQTRSFKDKILLFRTMDSVPAQNKYPLTSLLTFNQKEKKKRG